MKKFRFFGIVCFAFAALAAGGCASWFGEETRGQIAAQARKLVGTDELAAKFDAAQERQELEYAFVWLTAEKAGISETDARDWLAGRGKGGDGEDGGDEEDAAAADAIEFAALDWKFGGVDGSKAKLSSPRVSGLKAGRESISYHWDAGLSSWGLADGEAGALACWFVERDDGSIVGGKFDWVSTSRSTRPLKNVLEGYGGWSLEGVPNPCKCYFVVITGDGKKRSNVAAAEWSRQ